MLRIKNWDDHFETAKTRTFNRCQRLTFSNDLSDPHFRRLVRGHKDGYAHFGIWIAICEFHSSQSKPRLGYLTDNGQEDGNPLSASEIADLIRAPEKVVEVALERLSDPYIGWITDERRPCDDHATTIVDDQSSSLSTPLHSTPLKETKAKKAAPLKELFDIFWKAYPRKEGKDRCERWFNDHKPTVEIVDQMLVTIAAYKESEQWQEPRFIPHPSTWLNRGGWKDEQPKTEEESPTKYVHETLTEEETEQRRIAIEREQEGR